MRLTIKGLAKEMREFGEESNDDPPWIKAFRKLSDKEVRIMAHCALLSLTNWPLSEVFRWYEKSELDFIKQKRKEG